MAKRRKRGDGGISLRKDGRWEGRAVIGYDEKGLPVTKNVLAKTKTECAAKLKQLLESIATPVPEQPNRASCSKTGWTIGIRAIKSLISGPTHKCPMSAAFISTSSLFLEIFKWTS